jgi:hypothetical protein
MGTAQTQEEAQLLRFGFTFQRGGAHLSRTMMFRELATLFSYVENPISTPADYRRAICEDNYLQKRSGKTRTLTYRHLVDLYSLDPQYALFRALRFYWERDPAGRPLLALLCAYSRDSVLRSTAPFFLKIVKGTLISRLSVEEYIDNQEAGRFSKATLRSTAQNINATWTQAGHLVGRAHKSRSQAAPTAGSVSLALFLGYLRGVRGENLFHSEYTQLLDCSFDVAVDLASEASRRGWIVMKRVGTVIEVLFPSLLTEQELELIA